MYLFDPIRRAETSDQSSEPKGCHLTDAVRNAFAPGHARLLHKLINGITQAVDGAFVAQLDGIHHAVADVVV